MNQINIEKGLQFEGNDFVKIPYFVDNEIIKQKNCNKIHGIYLGSENTKVIVSYWWISFINALTIKQFITYGI